jgi:hypothetical protein
MRHVWIIVLAACSAPRPHPIAPSPELAAPECRPERVEKPAGDGAERAHLAREIEAVDRELDAIDAELAASEMAAGMGREQALGLVSDRIEAISKLAIDEVGSDAPLRLSEIAGDYTQALKAKLELSSKLGPKHPDMIEAEGAVDWLHAEFDRRRAAELTELSAWRDELGKLPHGAKPARVRQARLRAMRATLALAPSDAPAEVWLASQDIARVSHELEAMTGLGPKHPDRMRAEAELAHAKAMLASATTSASREIDAELARLDSTTSAPLKIDPAKISRRAELAAHARQLRRAYEMRYER